MPELGALTSVEFLSCAGEFLALEFMLGFIGELLLWCSSATWPSAFLSSERSSAGRSLHSRQQHIQAFTSVCTV